MMNKTGELPVYYPNDEDVYLRAADTADGELFCAVFNISTDPIDKLELVINRAFSKIDTLMPSGTRQPVSFETDEKGVTAIDTPCSILTPVILFIK